MAALGVTESAMGQHSNVNDTSKVYLLHGWRGNEDEDVDIESSDGSSQGEVADSRRLSEPDMRALDATISNGQLKTSVEETFEGADQECESRASAEAKDWQVKAGMITRGKLNKDLEGAGAPKGSSLVADEDEDVLQQHKRSNEGKRLDARRFRNIFAAKLSGSKKPSNASEGKEQGDAGRGLPGQVASSSSHELSGGAPTVIDRQPAQKGCTDEIERENSDAEALPKYVQSKLSSFSDVRDKSKAFSTKRKTVTRIEDISKFGKDRSPSRVTEASEENLLGRSKRVRKDNMQKDYISWSDFGRSSAKRNGRVSVEASRRNTGGKEGTSSCGKAVCQVDEAHREDVAKCASAEMKHAESNVGTISLGSGTDLKACESSQQGDTNQQKQKKSTNLQDIDGYQSKASKKSTPPPMHNAVHSRSDELAGEDVGHEMSGRPESCDKSCELVVLLNSGAIHESEVSQESAQTNGVCFSKESEGDGALSSIVRTDLETSWRQSKMPCIETYAEDPKRDGGSEPLLIGDTHTSEPFGYSDNHDSVCNWCKKEGNLICCDGKGCKLTYHITCLDPPLADVPPNDWYCPDCTYKRIMWGMHSVSKGLESIWDVKEGPLDETAFLNHIATHEARERHGQVAYIEKKGNIEQDLAGKLRCDGVATRVKGTAVLYYVKYKGLAHAYNKWLHESQVLKEAPKLLHTFKKKLEQGKACKWDPEWARPCKVIGKRVMMLRKSPELLSGGEDVQGPDRCLEWCVKWRNLGYEFCTWEPASKGPLCNAEGKELIEDYELRSRTARERTQGDGKHMVEHSSSSLLVDAGKLTASVKDEQLNQLQQDIVIKLCKFWEKGINGIVVADAVQERLVTTAMFLRCLLDVYQAQKPILIVAPHASIGLWEATFQEWAPSINVVVNGGTKEARQIIQRYEFYNEEKQLMAQIVLTSFDTLNLDVEYLKELKLEALIIDECQRLKGTKTSKSIRQLDSLYLLLLLNESLKETAEEYHHLLSVLSKANGSPEMPVLKDSESLAKLKASMGKYIVYESKQDNTENANPIEFWIPVKLTAFQVEEYCKLLTEKADMLARGKRGDIMSTPHALLLKLRECCNHPYLVNRSFQESLTHLTVEQLLEFGIQASGKLTYLDIMLPEAKASGKRIVVITQMHLRTEKESQMEILDDYMRQRFGVDSYERVDTGLAPSKKIAAVQRFNTKSSCFVFLLDKRACGPAIKLSSVNCIIIFDSDWNPSTDIQAVLKLGLHTQSEERASIPICRLYSPHSFEERPLIFARRMMELDNDYSKFTHALCQKLLRWGVRRNFEVLDRRQDQVDGSKEKMFFNASVSFLLGRSDAFTSVDDGNSFCLTTALCARQAGNYNSGLCLYGENDEELQEEETVPATDFWSEIFRARHIESNDAQGRELRARKKVRYCEGAPCSSTHVQDLIDEEEEGRRKRRKVNDFPDTGFHGTVNKAGSNSPLERELCPNLHADSTGNSRSADGSRLADVTFRISQVNEKDKTCTDKKGNGLIEAPLGNVVKDKRSSCAGVELRSNEGGNEPSTGGGVRTEQQQLLLSIKPDLDKLCHALKFQADTAAHVEQLLFSIGSSFKLPKDKSLLHSIELSLCWLAAEQQHYSIDRAATLALAEACFGVQLDKMETVHAKLEERVKKRYASSDQSAQQTREQENGPSQRGDVRLSSKVQQDHSVTSSVAGREDALPLSTGQEMPTQLVTQHLERSRSMEQQHLHLLTETAGELASPIVTHERHVTHEAINSPLPSNTQPTSEFHGVATDAGHVSSPDPNAKERWTNLRNERMQCLLNGQKLQFTKLDVMKKSYIDKIKHHYEMACAKLSTARNRSEAVEEEKIAYNKTLNLLEASFRSIRDNMAKQQLQEREKANRLLAFYMETGNGLPHPTSFNFEPFNLSESHVLSLLPSVLKTAIENGGLVSLSSSDTNRLGMAAIQADATGGNFSAHPSTDSYARQTSRTSSGHAVPNTGTQNHQNTPSNATEQVRQHRFHHYQNHQQRTAHHSHQALPLHEQQRWLSPLSREQAPTPQALASGLSQHDNNHLSSLETRQVQPSTSQLQPQQQPHLAQPQVVRTSYPDINHQQADVTRLHVGDGHVGDGTDQPSTMSFPLVSTCPLSASAVRGVSGMLGSPPMTSLPAPHTGALTFTQTLRGGPTTSSTSPVLPASHVLPSRLSQPQTNDPLVQELMRLRKEQDKIKHTHEAEKEKLKGQFMKELETLSRKYETMLQEEDAVYSRKALALETNMKKVEMNRRLAEVFRLKTAHESSSASAGLLNVPSSTPQLGGIGHQQQSPRANARSPGPLPTDLSRYATLPSNTVAGLPSSTAGFDWWVDPATVASTGGSAFVSSVAMQTGVALQHSQCQTTLVNTSGQGLVATRSAMHSSREISLVPESFHTRPAGQQTSAQSLPSLQLLVPSVPSSTNSSSSICSSLLSSIPTTSACTQTLQSMTSVFAGTSPVGMSTQYLGTGTPLCHATICSTAITSHSVTTTVRPAGMAGNISSPRGVSIQAVSGYPLGTLDANFLNDREGYGTSGGQFSRSIVTPSQPGDDSGGDAANHQSLPQILNEQTQVLPNSSGRSPFFDERSTDVICLSDDD